MAYIGSDGYLYTGGSNWGGTTSYKQSNVGQTSANPIVDYSIANSYALVVLEDGTIKYAANNTSTTATWTTLQVNSKDTGSTNPAVGVEISQSYQLVLMEDGSLYTGVDGATNMTSCVVTSSTASSRGGIVDTATSTNGYAFVLYGNGDLYRAAASNTSTTGWTHVAQDVEMFDYDTRSTYIYVYDGLGNIKVSSESRSLSTAWTTLATVANVVQIRGGYYDSYATGGWGYLTSDGTLNYRSGSPSSATNATITGVDYFDMSAGGTWGYLKNGKMYIWATSSKYYDVTSNTSATTVFSKTNATNDWFSIEDLQGNGRGLSNTPPATKIVSVQNKTDLKQIYPSL